MSAGQPRAIAEHLHETRDAECPPQPWRSMNTPKNNAPSPTDSAASNNVITDIEASTVQYGAGQASVPLPTRRFLVGLGVALP